MKKHFQLYLSMILIIVLTLFFTTQTFATDEKAYLSKIDATDENADLSKIETNLLEHMDSASDSELIPIHIVLQDLDENVLMEKVKAETGMDPEIYMNEDRFEKEVAGRIRTELEKKLGYEEAHKVVSAGSAGDELLSGTACTAIQSAFSNELKDLFTDPSNIIEYVQTGRSISIIDYAILEARQQFQAEKNRVLKEEQSSYINAFISSYVEKRNNEVKYASRYTSTLFIEATKADILYYAQSPDVVSIYYDDPNMVCSPTL